MTGAGGGPCRPGVFAVVVIQFASVSRKSLLAVVAVVKRSGESNLCCFVAP